MSSVINFYTKIGTRAAFLFSLLFDIIPEYFHHLVGDDVFHTAGVFFGKFGGCSELCKRLCKRLMPLVNALCLFPARVGETEISRFAVDMDIPFLFKEITSTARTFGCPLCSKRMVSKYISSDSLVLLIAMRAPPYIIYNIDYTLFSRKSKEKTRSVNIR